jgi:four helix bundle protein
MSADGPVTERKPIRSFRDLLVWQKAIDFARDVYGLTKRFPPDKRFGLTLQLRRAAVSVSSNIAEGHARQGKEFAHFLSIARGSLAECESQLHLAVVLGYLTEPMTVPLNDLASEIHRMSASLASELSY